MPRHLTRIVVGIAGVGLLASCGSGGDPLASSSTATSGTSTASGSSAGPIVVGSADFSESQLLAEIYAGALTAKGITATTKLNIGAREIYLKALQDGSVDLVPEYTGALAYYYDNTFSETDPDKVYAALQRLIPAQFTLLTKSAAEDNDSINVTKSTADKLKLSSIADLAAVAGDLTLGAPPEFQTRPQGIPGLAKTYGVTFKTFRPLKGQQLVQALKNGQVDAANIFSTDPRDRGQRLRHPHRRQAPLRLAECRSADRGVQGHPGDQCRPRRRLHRVDHGHPRGSRQAGGRRQGRPGHGGEGLPDEGGPGLTRSRAVSCAPAVGWSAPRRRAAARRAHQGTARSCAQAEHGGPLFGPGRPGAHQRAARSGGSSRPWRCRTGPPVVRPATGTWSEARPSEASIRLVEAGNSTLVPAVNPTLPGAPASPHR
jgi:osmoprotectant transport system substrate-binding protein